jgi:hypothetical protein
MSSSSLTQDLLDRIDRLQMMLVNEQSSVSLSSIPDDSNTILPRTITLDTVPCHHPTMIHSANNAFRSTMKQSDAMIIDELQHSIHQLECERQVLLQSYSIVLQLLKHQKSHSIDEHVNLIEFDNIRMFHRN